MFSYVVWGGAFRPEILTPARWRFSFWVALFVAGNLVFPALVHSLPRGGLMFLPIYFFTLIASYRFGVWAGLATALLSPLANHVLTGMPPLVVLDAILVKSVSLALIGALVASTSRQVSLASVALVIVGYQALGGLYEAIKAGSLAAAAGDWVIGWPGLVIQLIVGGAVLGVWGRSTRAR